MSSQQKAAILTVAFLLCGLVTATAEENFRSQRVVSEPQGKHVPLYSLPLNVISIPELWAPASKIQICGNIVSDSADSRSLQDVFSLV